MDIDKLDLNLLVTLDTLLVERNVTRAAQRLGISQPALSTRLTRLRDQEPLHAALEGVRQVVLLNSRFDPSSISATIAIAASDYVQYSVLMPLLDVLRVEAPGIRVAWRTIDTANLETQMIRGDVGLALTTPEAAPETLRMRKIYREEYVTIARLDHPAIGNGLDIETFCQLDHVIVSPRGGGFYGPADAALSALGQTRRVMLSAPGFLVVPEIVAHSDMIALVPGRLALNREDQLQQFAPPLPVTGFDMAMVWHDRTTTHPMHRWLRDRLITLVKQTLKRSKQVARHMKKATPHSSRAAFVCLINRAAAVMRPNRQT